MTNKMNPKGELICPECGKDMSECECPKPEGKYKPIGLIDGVPLVMRKHTDEGEDEDK